MIAFANGKVRMVPFHFEGRILQHLGFSAAFCDERKTVFPQNRAETPLGTFFALLQLTVNSSSRKSGTLVRNDGQADELIGCKTCGQVQRFSRPPKGYQVECVRCGETLLRERPFPRARTAAFALAALFLYVPANLYPVMVMQYLGRETENTVWAGVKALYHDGMWGVATIVFCASILVPLLKLLGLIFLVSVRGPRWQKLRTKIHKWIAIIGPWAMLDVFLLAIMVALIRFGSFATVIPGPGIFAFTAVVVLTLLASASFDPQLIWKNSTLEHDSQNTV